MLAWWDCVRRKDSGSLSKIRIEDLRLSFIWAETVLDSFRGSVRPRFDFLSIDYKYEHKFDEVVRNHDAHHGLGPPWPRSESRQRFWIFYLDGREPLSRVRGRQAFKGLVPFRKTMTPEVAIPKTLCDKLQIKNLSWEGFYYPHGLALVMTVRCQGDPLKLPDATNAALELRTTRGWTLRSKLGISRRLTLQEVGHRCLATLREEAFRSATPDARSSEPFTVFSVIKGRGVDLDAAPSPEIYRELRAVTKWRRVGGNDVKDFENSILRVSTPAPKGDVLFAEDRGRAVWFPYLFTQSTQRDKPLRSLGCYHRNLVCASLQTESLGLLVSRTAKNRRNGEDFYSPDHRECVRRASNILGQLYAGDYSTYRSWSPRVQIENNNLKQELDDIRDFFGMSRLAPQQAVTPPATSGAVSDKTKASPQSTTALATPT